MLSNFLMNMGTLAVRTGLNHQKVLPVLLYIVIGNGMILVSLIVKASEMILKRPYNTITHREYRENQMRTLEVFSNIPKRIRNNVY
jgi:hypothetical protein